MEQQINSVEIFKNALTDIENRRERRLSGQYNSILGPWDRMNLRFPGFERGKYWIFTASSGIGKTKFTKFFYVLSVYNFCKRNNIPFKIKYFALEETREHFWLSIIINLLKVTYKIDTDIQKILSSGDNVLDLEIIKHIKLLEPLISDMLSSIEVIDSESNPTGIWKNVTKYALENGRIERPDEYTKLYKPNNSEEYVFVITDHISLLSPERDTVSKQKLSKHDTISKFSSEYCLKDFCKLYDYIVINIQQQSADKEKLEFSYSGKSIEQKLEPSLDGLADNKLTQRDADFVWGLFSPARYSIESYNGYDITVLLDNYRCLKVLKDRHYGLANGNFHLYFDGATNNFVELPLPNEMQKWYLRLNEIRKINK